MDLYSGHINKLVEELAALPGIGGKSAQRLAFHIINMPKDRVERLTKTISDARENVHYCKICCTLTDDEMAEIAKLDKNERYYHRTDTQLIQFAGWKPGFEKA